LIDSIDPAQSDDMRHRLADLCIRVQAIEVTEFRVQSALASGQPTGAASSQLKVMGTEAQQAIDVLAIEALGIYAAPWQPELREMGSNEKPVGLAETNLFMPGFLDNRAATIYGGSSEVQRNILAKLALGF
jgi:acyl-CoA dehydrogenase